MHVHSAAMGLNAMVAYAAVNERAAAAQRAAEVRKRLLKAAQATNCDASQEETLLIGRWLNSSHPDQQQGQGSPAAGYRSAAEGEDSTFA
jgi:hypothetical protein